MSNEHDPRREEYARFLREIRGHYDVFMKASHAAIHGLYLANRERALRQAAAAFNCRGEVEEALRALRQGQPFEVPADVDDCFQEYFLKLIKSPASLARVDPDKAIAFLAACMQNAINDKLRARGQRKQKETTTSFARADDDGTMNGIPEPPARKDSDPAIVLAGRELERLIRRALYRLLMKLSPRLRGVLWVWLEVLHAEGPAGLERLRDRDIALRLRELGDPDVSLGAVTNAQHKLRDEIEQALRNSSK
jgi:DNA-directed RNA polymerase specialized sigma24 family protein